MHRFTTRWTTAAAAAAFLALPIAGAAQSTTPPQQPPAETQPPRTQQTMTTQPAATGQVDANAAKKHLSEARDTLSQLTSMPEAAKLQGDTRTQVSEVIANFNELITTQNDWRAAYGKVDANLTALLGPEGSQQPPPPASGTAGAVGTSGSAAAASELDPAVKAKLAEFRTHLKMFEQAAGGRAGESGAMAPSVATGTTSNPANPTVTPTPTTPDPAKPGQPPTTVGATGTSGESAADANKHLDAISTILEQSKTGTLTKAQTDELKKHVAELRALLNQRR